MGPTHSQPDLYMSWVYCLVTKSCKNAKWLLQAFGVLQETQEIMAIADDVKCREPSGAMRDMGPVSDPPSCLLRSLVSNVWKAV